MQLISVYLYQNKIDVFTNAAAAWKTERYRRVYNRNIKIFRGVDNRIDIQVRNSDEKAADTTGSTLVFNLVERTTQKLVVQKDCVVVDALKGKFYTILTQDELYDIETGFYQYSISKESRTSNGDNTYTVSSRTPLYIDSQYDALATAEILDNISGEPLSSIQVKEFNIHMSFGESFSNYYVSSIIDANPQVSNPQSLHTFQFYFTNYTGTVEVQGSLSEGGNPGVWTTLQTLTYTAEDLAYTNITGKYNFFRIKHTPGRSGTNATFTVSQTILLNYQVSINDAGLGYQIGDTVTVKGDELGGETPTNNLIITVTGVDDMGRVTGITWTGVSYNGVRTFVVSGTTPNIGTFDKILYR